MQPLHNPPLCSAPLIHVISDGLLLLLSVTPSGSRVMANMTCQGLRLFLEAFIVHTTDLEFLKILWGLGTEEE
jgi:hypothetical protein